MNILNIVPEGKGGIEIQTLRLAKALRKKGIISAFMTGKKAPLLKAYMSEGFEVLRFPKMLPHIRKFDIVMVHKTKFLPFVLPFLKGNRLIVVQHVETKGRSALHKLIFLRVDYFIATTRRLESKLRRLWGVENVRTIYYGVDIDRFKYSFGGNVISSIGSASRLVPAKNQEIILKAVKSIKNDVKLKVFFIGESTEYAKKLERMAGELSLDVFFLPFTLKVEDFFRLLDISVLSSKVETFGLVALESLASGVPLICSSAAGAVEILEDGKDSFIFRSEDELAEKILVLAKDSELRQKLAEEGRRKAELFSIERQADEFIRLFEDVRVLRT